MTKAERAKREAEVLKEIAAGAKADVQRQAKKIAGWLQQTDKRAASWGRIGDLRELANQLRRIVDGLYADGACLKCAQPATRMLLRNGQLVVVSVPCDCTAGRTR